MDYHSPRRGAFTPLCTCPCLLESYSPWWLQRQGRFEDAERALRRLASPTVDVKPTLAIIIETDRLEREIETGSTYLDCFKKINRRRTEIAVGVYTIQILSGIYLVGYATYFFTRKCSLVIVSVIDADGISRWTPHRSSLQHGRWLPGRRLCGDLLFLDPTDSLRPAQNLQLWPRITGSPSVHHWHPRLCAQL